MGPLATVDSFLQDYVGLSPATSEHLLATTGVLVGYFLLRRLARRIITRRIEDVSSRYQAANAIAYGLGIIVVAVLIRIWVDGLTGLATYLGLVSAGLAIALQDPLINLAGWIFIVIRRPFKVGDRIQIGPHTGDVVDIRLFRFVLLEIGNWVRADQSTGRVIHVPNGWVFKNSVASYDQAFGYIWNELDVVVTFESNWRRAKEVLTRTVTEHAEKLTEDAKKRIDEAAETMHIKFTKLTPVVWTSVVDHGVQLTMRYLCQPRDRRTSTSEMWESVLDAVDDMDDVELAYPTTRWFDNARETKLEQPSRIQKRPAEDS
jgi:small-conductance mechanosensitive channel